MAVTLTIEQAIEACNLSDQPTAAQQAQFQSHYDYAAEAVVDYSPDSSDADHNAALVRLLGYLWATNDAGHEAFPVRAHNPLTASGAAGILSLKRKPSIGSVT